MSMHWILVADATRARLYSSGPLLESFVEEARFRHPESRLHVGDLTPDRDGDAHRHTVDLFARELAAVLQAGRTQGAYERLVLVASPQLLGRLRQHLDRPTSRTVVAALDHDWSALPADELPGRVRDALPETAGMPPMA